MLTELKNSLIEEARKQYGEITPPHSRSSLMKSFSISKHRKTLYLWFNDSTGSTRVVGAPVKLRGRQ